MEATIKNAYEENFGTAYETYKQSVKQDSSIWYQGVKDYLSKRDDIQTHFNIRNITVLFQISLYLNLKLI